MPGSQISRREFVRLFGNSAGCFVATASLSPLSGCSDPHPAGDSSTRYSFPQGVASADPQPDAIILWTRVEGENAESVNLRLQLAVDAEFDEVLLELTGGRRARNLGT